MPNKASGKWELFTCHYQNKKFGTEDEFLPEDHIFTVCTDKGKDDAKDSCLRHHPSCKIICVLNQLEEASNTVDVSIVNQIKDKSKKGKKK